MGAIARAAGWIVLFTVIYAAGIAGFTYAALGLFERGSHTHPVAPLLVFILGCLLLPVGLGYAVAHASGRGPALSLVLGIVVALGGAVYQPGARRPHGAREITSDFIVGALTVLLFVLGGLIYRWTHRRKTAGPDAPPSSLEETGPSC